MILELYNDSTNDKLYEIDYNYDFKPLLNLLERILIHATEEN